MRNDSISSNSGVTKIQWVSSNIFIRHLDNSICRKIVAGWSIGGVLSIWISEPIISKAVATALGLVATTINYFNTGKGVVVQGMIRTPLPVTILSIKSQ